jgi:hypothetical protein
MTDDETRDVIAAIRAAVAACPDPYLAFAALERVALAVAESAVAAGWPGATFAALAGATRARLPIAPSRMERH